MPTEAGDEIVLSVMEHHANIVPWHFLRERQGVVLKWVDVDASGALDPQVSAASIVKIELPDQEEPFIPFAARMGATFLHGAAVTIHKAQGSQWENVQVFAPDLYAAARMGRIEAGQPLWKRLAYVAITRAQERLFWVVRNRLSKPTQALSTDDLSVSPLPLQLDEEIV